MPDALPQSTIATLDDPFAQLSGPLAGTTRLDFEVADSARLTPHMQRLRLTAPQLAGFQYLPGQDVMLLVAADGNRPLRRRYTIREFDRAERLVTLDIVLHGEGPGERWVRSAAPGDRIEGIGPRGKITISAGADWHLFLTDESGLPAAFAMTGALPSGSDATLVIEVPEEQDEQDLPAPASPGCTVLPAPLATRPRWPPRQARWNCRPAAVMPTSLARRGSCPGCGRFSARAGWPRSRCPRRRTGAAAGPTPATASPRGTPDQSMAVPRVRRRCPAGRSTYGPGR